MSTGATLATFGVVTVVAASHASGLHPILPASEPKSFLTTGTSWIGIDQFSPSMASLIGIMALIPAAAAFLFAARTAWRGDLSLRTAIWVAVAFAGLVLLVPLLLSRDVYNYALYGRMVSIYHRNPYTTVPDDIGAADPFFLLSGEKWRDIPSVYGPAFTALSGLVTSVFKGVTGAVLAFRVIAVAGSICTIFAIAALARRLSPSRAAFAVVLFGWNPVIVFHAVGGGHNDILVGLCIVLALLLVSTGHPALATATLALGASIKASAGIALLLMVIWFVASEPTVRERVRTAVTHCAIAAGVVLSFGVWFWQTQNPTLGLAEVSTHEGGFSFVTVIFYTVGRAIGAAGGWPVQNLAQWLIRVGFLILFLVVLAAIGRRLWTGAVPAPELRELGAGIGWTLLVLMMVSPFILTWYIAWLIPIAFLLPKVPRTVVLTLSVIFAVLQTVAEPLRSTVLYETVVFLVSWIARPVVGVLLVWLLLDLRQRLRDGAPLAENQS